MANFRKNYYTKIGQSPAKAQALSLQDALKDERAIDVALLRGAVFKGVPDELRYSLWRILLFHTAGRQAEFADLLATVYARDAALLWRCRQQLRPYMQAVATAGQSDDRTAPVTSSGGDEDQDATALHAFLPSLQPYDPSRFNDMYCIWAGEILPPALTLQSGRREQQEEAAEEGSAQALARIRNAIAEVVFSVAPDAVEAFWLTAAFWTAFERHQEKEAEAAVTPMDSRVIQVLSVETPALTSFLSLAEIRTHRMAVLRRWLASALAGVLPNAFVASIWDLYLVVNSLDIIVLAAASVLFELRSEIMGCRTGAELEQYLSAVRLGGGLRGGVWRLGVTTNFSGKDRLRSLPPQTCKDILDMVTNRWVNRR